MAINDKLKFSWGHIFAFLALIALGYFSFLGLTYLTDGNFLLTGIISAACMIITALFFIGAQLLKATDMKFGKRIHFERVLVFTAPFVLCVMMYPACHFWNAFENRAVIEEDFASSVMASEQMFSNYEEYSNQRIKDYEVALVEADSLDRCRDIKVGALFLQLLGGNYTELKSSALDWAGKAEGATVWNVFMIANLKTIRNSIISWKDQLVSASQKRMSDEVDVVDFDSDSSTLGMITDKFNNIKAEYSKKGLSVYAVIMVIFFYILLMFPYVIQQRNTKSIYHLFFKESKSKDKGFIIEEKTAKASENPEQPENDEDEYGSFTM